MGKSFNTGNLTNIIGYSGSNVAITGSVNISGTVVSTGTSLVSGSGQISYTGITNIPSGIVSGSAQILNGSGIWSGSAQLPSGVVSGSSQVLNGTTIHSGSYFNSISVVSGSVQIDVMSTTNIARLATTGSNTFNGNQIVSGSFKVSGSIESSYDGLATEGGQLVLRGPVNRYNVDNWSGNAIRLFREDDATAGNGNVIIFASGSGQVGINKNATNSTLDVNGNALVSGSLTTTGTINGISIPNDLFAQQFLLMGA